MRETQYIMFSQTIAPSSALKSYELLHRITGEGLSVEYCFSRQPFTPDANMVVVQMQFTNNSTSDTKNLHMEDVKLQSGMRVKEFPEIGNLGPERALGNITMNISYVIVSFLNNCCFYFGCGQSCCQLVRRPQQLWASISVTQRKLPTSSCGEQKCLRVMSLKHS